MQDRNFEMRRLCRYGLRYPARISLSLSLEREDTILQKSYMFVAEHNLSALIDTNLVEADLSSTLKDFL